MEFLINYLLDDIHPVDDLAKDDVSTIQPLCLHGAHEELQEWDMYCYVERSVAYPDPEDLGLSGHPDPEKTRPGSLQSKLYEKTFFV